MREKESLESKLEIASEKAGGLSDKRRNADAGKYEMKYRDLKESFRLYRKKAKEIFEPAFNRPSGTQKHMCMIILHQPGQGGDLRICCACVH